MTTNTSEIITTLVTAGFVQSTRKPQGEREIRSEGFEAVPQGGRTVIRYYLGSWVDLLAGAPERVKVGQQVKEMERLLSGQGYSVIMFEPQSGTGYTLTVR